MRFSIVLLLCAIACSVSNENAHPRADHVARLASLLAKKSALRTIGDFDITADGRVDGSDIGLVEGLRGRMEELAKSHNVDPAVAAGLYTDTDPLVLTADGTLASDSPPQRIRAALIETRWLADQSKFAAVVAWEPEALLAGSLARHIPGYDAETMAASTLCTALDSLDLADFERAGLPAVMVTDLDFTIWQGDLSNMFLAVLAERELVRPELNPVLVEFLSKVNGVDAKAVQANNVHKNVKLLYDRATDTTLPKDQRVPVKDAFFMTVRLLEGLDTATVDQASDIAVTKGAYGAPGAMQRYHQDASGCGTAAVLAKGKARGVEQYLLSATLEPLARAAARGMGLAENHAIGSPLEIKGGRYTGQVIASIYELKGPVLRQWVGVPPLMVFGDSATSDMPMMVEAIGTGFMVNPRAEILEKDKEVAGGRMVSVTFTKPESRASR